MTATNFHWLWLLIASTALARSSPKPMVDAELPRMLEASATTLRDSMNDLETGNKLRESILKAERSIRVLTKNLDRYFHGRNQNERRVRDVYLRTRAIIHRLRGGEQPILIFVNGIAHFHPRVHWLLAMAYSRMGKLKRQRLHIEAVLATQPTHLDALKALKALQVSGKPDPP